jgi:hypothetical protein
MSVLRRREWNCISWYFIVLYQSQISYIKYLLLLLSGDFSGYRRPRPIVWTSHSILGIKALRNNVKEPGTEAASPRSSERLRVEGLLSFVKGFLSLTVVI